mgnify:CR=1 FL=1
MINHHQSNDWKMFWIIENKDLKSLEQLCQQLKTNNQDINMYFNMKSWQKIFTPEEAQQIKVYMRGLMDFCPVQHAFYLGWVQGFKCLYDNQIGCQTQGCGLGIIDLEKFYDSCKSHPEYLLS